MAGASLVIALGCGGRHGLQSGPPSGSGAGGAMAGDRGGAGGDPAAAGGTMGTSCTGAEVFVPKRVVRLSFTQIEQAIRSLLGGAIADQIAAAQSDIPDPQHRAFPPLASPREGSLITDGAWAAGDQIAQQAAQWVSAHFATATGCAVATDDCAQAFLAALATRAFRHPATPDESAAVLRVYADDKSFGGTVEEATEYGVYAILSAPQFLYRTELGASGLEAGALTPYELASALSFFLTDGPPDAPLLAAAASGGLASPDQVRAQVARMMATPEARANLEAALFAYFSIPNIESVIIDTALFPSWNDRLRASMRHESELFLHDKLWNGPLTELLTSRTSRVDASLADFYGVAPFPRQGATLDGDGFALTQLPGTRSGLLTQPAFLAARSRPTGGSIIGRGLLVNAAIVCGTVPAVTTDTEVTDEINAAAILAGKTEREKAAFRVDPSHSCARCHAGFDPYGLALENYDGIGHYRTVDDQGRVIDASAMLPPAVGGKAVANAVEMSAALAGSDAFATCMARSLMVYALAEVSAVVSPGSCATQSVARAVAAGNGTFTSLVTEVAVSRTLAVRAAGGGAP